MIFRFAPFALLLAATLSASGAVTLPDSAKGVFVQTKTLADVGLSLKSSGTWEFEKDRRFVYHALKPVESLFIATPTNFSYTAGGRTFARALKSDISSLEGVFGIREVKDAIASIETEGTNFPYRVKVAYRNGDRLDVEFSR